jgi:DNA mismatch endonuclease, patch repair protein
MRARVALDPHRHLERVLARAVVDAAQREHVVFVDGCFWHGCPRCGRIPRTNPNYWRAKIGRNQRRDRRTRSAIRAAGFVVV